MEPHKERDKEGNGGLFSDHSVQELLSLSLENLGKVYFSAIRLRRYKSESESFPLNSQDDTSWPIRAVGMEAKKKKKNETKKKLEER